MTDVAPLQASERGRWAQLWAEYQRFYAVDLSPAVTDHTWARLQSGRIHCLGARDTANQLVGIVHYLFHEDTWSTQSACYLSDLYVDPTVRGAGYGRRLIQAVAHAAKAAGANSPYWLTQQNNTSARQLYDRLATNHGFIQYAYVEPAP